MKALTKYIVVAVVFLNLSTFKRDVCGWQAISASDYQAQMGIGFSTDWFKTSNLGKHYTSESLVQSMRDIRARGFTNLRLRSRADIWGFADADPDTFTAATELDNDSMQAYLAELDKVLDTSLATGIVPTISWIHHHAEGRANTDDGDNFVQWWQEVAEHTKNRSHQLSFNLMTEVGRQDPDGDGVNGVYDSPETWNDWTQRAIDAIRGTGGNNLTRNIIIAAPRNTQQDSLGDIDESILADDHLLLEYHAYASGATADGRNSWAGTGSEEDRARLTDRLSAVLDFSEEFEIPAYWGAWTPIDLKEASLTQDELEAFASFFGETLAQEGIPWSMNKIDHFYDTLTNQWLESGEFGDEVSLDVSGALSAALAGHARGTAVPEPSSSIVLLLFGFLAVGRERSKRAF